MTREISRLTMAGAQLGESPVWDATSQGLYWVDIERGDQMSILELNVESYRRRTAVERRKRPGRPPSPTINAPAD